MVTRGTHETNRKHLNW